MLRYIRDLMKLTDMLPLTDKDRATRRTAFAELMKGVYRLAEPQLTAVDQHVIATTGLAISTLYLDLDREALARMPEGKAKEEAKKIMEVRMGESGAGA